AEYGKRRRRWRPRTPAKAEATNGDNAPMSPPQWPASMLVCLTLASCSSATRSAFTTDPPTITTPSGSRSSAPTQVAPATASPSSLPAYAIEALRSRPEQPGTLHVGELLASASGFHKHTAAWTSMGATMTGVIDLPTGRGPFPVVVVNHGYVPTSQYYVGQDSSKYGDALAAQGLVTISPNYPGYGGSGP